MFQDDRVLQVNRARFLGPFSLHETIEDGAEKHVQEVELFECRVCSTKPYDDRGGMSINGTRESHLVTAFLGIKLVDG